MSNALLQLFAGFEFAYGTDEGGCRWHPVNDDLAERHLSGEEMIGIYPMVYDPHVIHCGSAEFDTSLTYGHWTFVRGWKSHAVKDAMCGCSRRSGSKRPLCDGR